MKGFGRHPPDGRSENKWGSVYQRPVRMTESTLELVNAFRWSRPGYDVPNGHPDVCDVFDNGYKKSVSNSAKAHTLPSWR